MVYKDSPLEQGIEYYQEVVDAYYKPFAESYSRISENCLVNYIFRELISYKRESPLENYMDLILHYSIIKIHLIGVAAYNKNLDIDKCIDTIQMVCKKYEHSDTCFDIVLDYMKKRYYKFDFALIAMLLRD